MVYCSKCGQELAGDANFCINCGVRTLKGMNAGVPIPQDWLSSGLTQLGKDLESALTTAAKEVEGAFNTAREKIQESTGRKQVNCPNCGEKMQRTNAKYCYKCGKQI